MDGMKETTAGFDDVINLIEGLKIAETTKQGILEMAQEKKNGSREAGEKLCHIAKMLRLSKNITWEQYAQILVFAQKKNGQNERQKSDNGIWRKLKCWLKEFFSWR